MKPENLNNIAAPRVLFIKPYWKASAASFATPPLGLLYLSSCLKEAFPKAESRLLDLRFLQNKGKVEAVAREFRPDIVAIQCMTGDDHAIRSISSKIKQIDSAIHITCGGPYPTHSPEIFESFEDVDSILRGEGEISFVELVRKIRSKQPSPELDAKGISVRTDSGKLDVPEFSPAFQDLDEIPMPDWSLVDIDLYSRTSHFNSVMKGKRYMVLFTSRGCPFNCIYCHNIFGKKVRMRSPENVVREIEILVSEYGVDEIQIIDDIFNYNKTRLKAICDLIITKGLKVNICFPNGLRGDMLDEEMILKLKIAGTYMITFAIETASERLQKLIKKNLNIEKTTRAIRFANRIGLLTRCFFIIGFPTETRAEIQKTVRLPSSLPLTTFSIFQATPFKGTELYSLAEKTASPEAVKCLEDTSQTFFARRTFFTIDTGINLKRYVLLCYFRFFTPYRLIRFFWKIPQKRLYMRQISGTLLVGFFPQKQEGKQKEKESDESRRHLYKIKPV